MKKIILPHSIHSISERETAAVIRDFLQADTRMILIHAAMLVVLRINSF